MEATYKPQIGNLVKLRVLDLEFNRFEGQIPANISHCLNLIQLGLTLNILSGIVPSQIGLLSKLQVLALDANQLEGDLLNKVVVNLTSLQELYAMRNAFHGSIPDNIGITNKYLSYIVIAENSISGIIPPSFYNLSQLESISLNYNQLQGTLPLDIGFLLPKIKTFHIDHNFFHGNLPASLSNLTNLIILGAINNNFTGKFMFSSKNMPNLKVIQVSGNYLGRGEADDLNFLQTLVNCSKLKTLEFSGDRFGGMLPKFLVASLVGSVSIVALVYFLLCSRRKRNKPSQGSQLNLIEPFSKISYDMLLKATDRFSEANLLGVGRFGSVYKGVLDHQERNTVVAVKVISLEQRGATKSFMAECEALRSIRHRNLLKIVTVCSSTDFQGNDFKALVYEFMTNGSLHQRIHTDPRFRRLSLLQRVEIAIDVASALDYLHNGCDTPIIHCDLKPSNILLDNDMVAHVGDFGLARFHLRATANNSSSIAVKGTVGYAAPEYGLGSMVSKEGDVYSFGIVLLEMMISKSPADEMFERGLDLHNYANSAALSDQLENIIDPRLLEDGGTSEGNEGKILTEIDRKHKCIKSIIEIGVKCSVESPQDRMRIKDAIGELQVTKDALLKQLHVIRAKRV
uniref:Protein kinase domain-containing protein n=1 Tax=Chenopodium quinoa TaxID=63459 RepID=A0A803KW70_CHEQI